MMVTVLIHRLTHSQFQCRHMQQTGARLVALPGMPKKPGAQVGDNTLIVKLYLGCMHGIVRAGGIFRTFFGGIFRDFQDNYSYY